MLWACAIAYRGLQSFDFLWASAIAYRGLESFDCLWASAIVYRLIEDYTHCFWACDEWDCCLCRVDGGVCNNDFLMQMISDVVHQKLDRSAHSDMTSLGAAFLAGLASGKSCPCFATSLSSSSSRVVAHWKGPFLPTAVPAVYCPL